MSRLRSLMVGWFTGVSRASSTTVFSVRRHGKHNGINVAHEKHLHHGEQSADIEHRNDHCVFCVQAWQQK
eukprot:1144170-Pelagomonas_calceolata.AAC.7